MLSKNQKLCQYYSDLGWVQCSKSLLDIFGIPNTLSPCDYFSKLDLKSDASLKSLENLYTPPPNRMGRYFEQLVYILLQQLLGKERILRGILIRDGKRVVGEADFVFWNGQQEDSQGCIDLDHWEIACKFYLFVGKKNEDLCIPDSYQGLHLKDSLRSKLKHLCQKQLKIFETKVGKQSLKKNFDRLIPIRENRPLQVTSKSLMVGRFYYPYSRADELGTKIPVNGVWFSYSELELLNKREYRFAILTNNELLERIIKVEIEFDEFKQRIATIFQDFRRAGVFFTYLDESQKRYHAVVVSQQWIEAISLNNF